NYIPLANLPANQWQGSVPRPSNSNDVNFKIDYLASSRHQIMGSYFFTKGFEYQKLGGMTSSSVSTIAFLPWSQQNYDWTQQNVNFGETWIMAPSAINQFHLTYVRDFGGRVNLPNLSLADLGSKFTIQGAKSLPQITVTGYFTLFEAIQGPIAGGN